MLKKLCTGFAVAVLLIPVAASAQSINLSIQARQQLLTLAQQLVQILNELSQAQTYGPAYLMTTEFAQKGVAWTSQLTLIQQQVALIFSSAAANPIPTYPQYPSYPGTSGGRCPSLYRDLEPGTVGSDVGELQQFLSGDPGARYTGPIHNLYDPATVQALQRFQVGYGIVAGGAWNTTGFGRVGPATRSMIASVCSRTGSVPSYPNPGYPQNQTPMAGSSSGALTVTNVPGQSQNTVTFTLTAFPNSACSSLSYTVVFGDGQEQVVSFPASCSNQTQTITHVYPGLGSFTATLKSGTFQSAMPVSVAPSNYSISLAATQSATTSYMVTLTATYNPGTRCDAMDYTITWGDGSDRLTSFSGSNCVTQTRTYEHTYSGEGTYLIEAKNNTGGGTSVSVSAMRIQAAGSGDPNTVLRISAEGPNGSPSIYDSSASLRSLSSGGNPRVDTGTAKVGSGSLYLNGSSFVSALPNSEFNYGSGAFTLDFWFKPQVLPTSGAQAAMLVQANAQAADSSLGGAGLELFGSKLAFVGTIGGVTYHPFYNNTILSSALSANTWYHGALVRSGSTVTLYLNGVSQGSVAVSGSANASNGSLSLGRYGEYAGNYFQGWLDEVRIAKGLARWTANFNPDDGSTGNPGDGVTQTITLTSGSTWTVPSDWNSGNNTIQVIGGGGGGSSSGGGGGAYSAVTNVSLTPGSTVSYSVGTGGGAGSGGGDTYFCISSSNCTSITSGSVVVGAKGGFSGSDSRGAAGGAASSGVGTTKRSGGSGGAAIAPNGGGGGGAGGSSSDGSAGSSPSGGSGGGGKAGAGGGGGTTLFGGVGNAYGGGGGGAGSGGGSGGSGAGGIIVITWD